MKNRSVAANQLGQKHAALVRARALEARVVVAQRSAQGLAVAKREASRAASYVAGFFGTLFAK